MYICSFCNKECKNQNSLTNHKRFCKSNPDHIIMPPHRKGISSWNSGLTSKDDSRILCGSELADAVKQGMINSNYVPTGRALTEEKEQIRRQKLSAVAKERNLGGYVQGSGRGKKGWYKGFFCDSTYELVYVIFNLDNDIPFKKCQKVYQYLIDGKTHNYHPDFELADGTLVEIEGYHNSLVDIKAAAVKDTKIDILYESDLKYAFDWVENHYAYKELADLYEK